MMFPFNSANGLFGFKAGILKTAVILWHTRIPLFVFPEKNISLQIGWSNQLFNEDNKSDALNNKSVAVNPKQALHLS